MQKGHLSGWHKVVLVAAFLPYAIPDTIAEHTFKRPIRSFERWRRTDVHGQVAAIIASTPDGETLIYKEKVAIARVLNIPLQRD